MGTDIDTIFKMLSWNSSEKEQLRGIDEAKKIEYLSVLFQPIEDKSVWENCAKVISSKSDNELKKYMNDSKIDKKGIDRDMLKLLSKKKRILCILGRFSPRTVSILWKVTHRNY